MERRSEMKKRQQEKLFKVPGEIKRKRGRPMKLTEVQIEKQNHNDILDIIYDDLQEDISLDMPNATPAARKSGFTLVKK
jgi:hypothetical protein